MHLAFDRSIGDQKVKILAQVDTCVDHMKEPERRVRGEVTDGDVNDGVRCEFGRRWGLRPSIGDAREREGMPGMVIEPGHAGLAITKYIPVPSTTMLFATVVAAPAIRTDGTGRMEYPNSHSDSESDGDQMVIYEPQDAVDSVIHPLAKIPARIDLADSRCYRRRRNCRGKNSFMTHDQAIRN